MPSTQSRPPLLPLAHHPTACPLTTHLPTHPAANCRLLLPVQVHILHNSNSSFPVVMLGDPGVSQDLNGPLRVVGR